MLIVLQTQMIAGLNHPKVLLLSINEFSIHSPAFCVNVEQLEENVISYRHVNILQALCTLHGELTII